MNRVSVAALVLAVAAASSGGGWWFARTRSAARPAPDRAPTKVDSVEAAAALKQQIEALRSENDALRRANRACRAGAAAAASTVDGDDQQKKAVAEALDEDHKRAVEEAATDDHARALAWSSHLASDLGLSQTQQARLDETAKWAEDQRAALADRSEKESLDTKAVREEIAKQRDEYEQRMKTLLTSAQFQEFDAIQGIDRRPPTFARVPWILGDRAVAR